MGERGRPQRREMEGTEQPLAWGSLSVRLHVYLSMSALCNPA